MAWGLEISEDVNTVNILGIFTPWASLSGWRSFWKSSFFHSANTAVLGPGWKKWKCSSLSLVWLCDAIDGSPPGSSVHGILQARILEWVAIPFSRGSSPPRDQTQASCTASRLFTVWATGEALYRSDLINSSHKPQEKCTVIICSLQKREVRLRKGKRKHS